MATLLNHNVLLNNQKPNITCHFEPRCSLSGVRNLVNSSRFLHVQQHGTKKELISTKLNAPHFEMTLAFLLR